MSTYRHTDPRRHATVHDPHESFPQFLARLDGAHTPCRYGTEWTSENRRHQRRAAQLCQACHVLPECRAYSFQDPDVIGVAGGLTPNDRRALVARLSA